MKFPAFTLKPHLEQFKDLFSTYLELICADAGYGSEENYDYLEEQNISNYVKYNYFHKEQSKKWKEDPFKSQNLFYNEGQDKLYCPIGQPMDRIGDRKSKTSGGYTQTYARYQAKNCDGCPLRGSCHKAKGNRIVEINHNLNRLKQTVRENLHNLNRLKQTVRENLTSEQGLKHRSKRPWDVEATFRSVKHNKGFRRFMMKRLDKVEIEAGLLALAHNLVKKAN